VIAVSQSTPHLPYGPEDDDEEVAEEQPLPSDTAQMEVKLEALGTRLSLRGRGSGRNLGLVIATAAFATAPIATLWIGHLSGLPIAASLSIAAAELIGCYRIIRLLRPGAR
jgi:hypothetical protein